MARDDPRPPTIGPMVNFLGYSVAPFPCGGAGRVRVVLDGAVDAVVALIGLTPAAVWNDPTLLSVGLSLEGADWRGVFFGACRSPESTVSIYVQQGGLWSAGPVISPVPLCWGYLATDFPWIKRFLVDRLQETADELMPLGAAQRLKISSVYPRDIGAFPVVSIQIDSVQPASESVGRISHASADGTKARGANYNLNASITAWCETPEDRDDIAVWLGSAMEVLIETLPHLGCLEPSANLEEAEDFQTLGVPVFLATARLHTSRWSVLVTPKSREYGLLISS